MICIFCKSNHIHKDGNHKGKQRYKCLDCNKRFDGENYAVKYIEHFNVKIKDKSSNKLTRDNYCIPTNKTASDTRKNVELAEMYKKNNIKAFIPSYYLNLPNDFLIDKNTYSDSWVQQHYEDCMYNFDLNMQYFNSLDREQFDKALNKFIKKNKFIQIYNLNKAEVKGIYLLVLDEYKQVYIGISNNIKKRVLRHWNDRKAFSRLIFGTKEESVLSIDSFGALDTTRIFIKEVKWHQDINKMEEKFVSELNGKYTLNRIKGGLNDNSPDVVKYFSALFTMKKRKF